MRLIGLRWMVLLLGLGLAAAGPASAAAPNPYARVLSTYEQTGTVPPCAFSGAELSAALKGVDVYGQQYFADFTQAVQAALSSRAAGACQPSGAAAGAGSAAAAGTSLPQVALTAPTGSGFPLPLLLLAGLALCGAATAGALTLARAQAWGVGPPGTWRHLWQEAGWRTAGLGGDMGDWLRDRPRPGARGAVPGEDGAEGDGERRSADGDRHPGA